MQMRYCAWIEALFMIQTLNIVQINPLPALLRQIVESAPRKRSLIN